MLGALDRAFDDQPVTEMDVLVRTQTVCAIVVVLVVTRDDEGAAVVVEPDDIFLVDVIRGAGVNPVGLPVVSPCSRSGGRGIG